MDAKLDINILVCLVIGRLDVGGWAMDRMGRSLGRSRGGCQTGYNHSGLGWDMGVTSWAG